MPDNTQYTSTLQPPSNTGYGINPLQTALLKALQNNNDQQQNTGQQQGQQQIRSPLQAGVGGIAGLIDQLGARNQTQTVADKLSASDNFKDNVMGGQLQNSLQNQGLPGLINSLTGGGDTGNRY